MQTIMPGMFWGDFDQAPVLRTRAAGLLPASDSIFGVNPFGIRRFDFHP